MGPGHSHLAHQEGKGGKGEGLKLTPPHFGCFPGLGEDILGWKEFTDSLLGLSPLARR